LMQKIAITEINFRHKNPYALEEIQTVLNYVSLKKAVIRGKV